jgi:hypothetical protein
MAKVVATKAAAENGNLPRWIYRYTHLITEVKQCWAPIVLGWVTTQMTSTPVAVQKYTRILWPRKVSEKTLK